MGVSFRQAISNSFHLPNRQTHTYTHTHTHPSCSQKHFLKTNMHTGIVNTTHSERPLATSFSTSNTQKFPCGRLHTAKFSINQSNQVNCSQSDTSFDGKHSINGVYILHYIRISTLRNPSTLTYM